MEAFQNVFSKAHFSGSGLQARTTGAAAAAKGRHHMANDFKNGSKTRKPKGKALNKIFETCLKHLEHLDFKKDFINFHPTFI